MISDVKSDLGAWVAKLVSAPDVLLRIGKVPIEGDLFTNKQLLDVYDPDGRTKTTANGLGRELRRAGVPQVLDGKPVRTVDGQDRFYVIRNKAKWVGATGPVVIKYLERNKK